MAIWNKDKIVMAIAFAVWFTNAAASTEGSPPLPLLIENRESHTNAMFR